MEDAAREATETLVDPAEDVCRLCFSAEIPISRDSKHPNQIDSETGLLRLEEIGWQDVSERGFSLQRRHLYSHTEAVAEAERRDKAKTASRGIAAKYRLAGTLIARVEAINSIADEVGAQVFRVLETPSQHAAHAEVRIAEHLKKHHFLKFRINLRDVLGRLRPAEDIDRPMSD